MENGTRNKRRAHHAETNSGTDIVTSDKRMHTRLAVLFHFFLVSYPLLVLLTYSLIQNIWLYYIYTTIYERNMQILIRTMYLHFIHVLYRIQSVSELFGIFIQLRFLCNNIHKNPNTLKYVHT